MILRIKFLSPILTLLPIFFFQTPSTAQKSKKADKIVLADLEAHTRYLSDTRLEGRRMGTPGEKLASDYIISELSKAGVQPRGDNNGWLQTFDIDNGRQVNADAFLVINDRPFVLNKEYFPLAFSAAGSVSGSPAIALQESGAPWFQDLRELLEAGAGNPNYDLRAAIRAKAAAFAKKGATALILYNSGKTADNLAFDPRDKEEPVAIPVVYITREAKRKYLRDDEAELDLKLKVAFSEKERVGRNIVGCLNNGAASTVVIAAHYDGPGAAADGMDSSVAGKTWGDDVPGVAGLIELSRMLAASKLKGNNYLFVAFSGEEQGAYGSKWLAAHLPAGAAPLNYVLDLDRIDPMVDSSHALVVGGYGTSPAWWGICREVKEQKGLSLRLDSAYSHAGDYTSFYSRNIPVLALYSGSDDNACDNELMIVKYAYEVIAGANNRGRLAFARLNQ
ncbi:MAG TPA: M28 family peptidase [Puia sp.]|nr:M28 family peptidase [Puia sp.]